MLVVAATCCAAILGGCSGDSGDADDTGEVSASPSPSETSSEPPPPQPAPRDGLCYRLDEQQMQAAHVDADPVDCGQQHTSQTYLVGKLLGEVVRSSDTVDSAAISRTVDQRCADAFDDHVGGDAQTRTLARVRYVWFVPSESEFGRGANWFRCDVMADREHGTPAALPATTSNLLDDDGAIDRWGTCDQAGAELNAEVDWRLCSEPHNWKAIAVVPVGEEDTPWPGVGELRARGDDCEAPVRSYVGDSTGALAFRWSYPTEQQWRAGRRHGLCWTRES